MKRDHYPCPDCGGPSTLQSVSCDACHLHRQRNLLDSDAWGKGIAPFTPERRAEITREVRARDRGDEPLSCLGCGSDDVVDRYPWRDVLDRAFDCVTCDAITYYAGPSIGWEHSTGEARRAMNAAFNALP